LSSLSFSWSRSTAMSVSLEAIAAWPAWVCEGCTSSASCGLGPRCGTGCGGAACGIAAGGETTILSYVGQGGNWQAETTYKYVGGGAGNFEMVQVPTKWYSYAWLWLTVPVFLILIWIFFPQETTTTTTMPPPTTTSMSRPDIPPPTPAPTPSPTLPPKICKIYGDPHVDTFDGVTVDYYAPGEYWLVKSTQIKIQGRYAQTRMTNGLSVTKQVAIGGPFLKGHVLIVGAIHAWWDGKPILTTFPSSFSQPEVGVQIKYDAQGEILQRGREARLCM